MSPLTLNRPMAPEQTDPSDEQIVEAFRVALPAGRDQLAQALATVLRKQSDGLYCWSTSTSDAPLTLPYVTYEREVWDLIAALVSVDAPPVFGWIDWPGQADLGDQQSIEHAPLADILRRSTTIIRG